MRKFKKSGILKNKSLNIVSRFFLSSFIVISFFYVAPIIINFTDNNFFKDESSDKSYKKSKDIKKISTNNIKKMLENSLQNEDYEMAAKLRDELNSRKSIR